MATLKSTGAFMTGSNEECTDGMSPEKNHPSDDNSHASNHPGIICTENDTSESDNSRASNHPDIICTENDTSESEKVFNKAMEESTCTLTLPTTTEEESPNQNDNDNDVMEDVVVHDEQEMSCENIVNDDCHIFPDPEAECSLVIQSVYSQAEDPELIAEEENNGEDCVSNKDEISAAQRHIEVSDQQLAISKNYRVLEEEIPEKSNELMTLLSNDGGSSILNPELDPNESIDLISKIGIDAILKGFDNDLMTLTAVTCESDREIPSPDLIVVGEQHTNQQHDVIPSFAHITSNVAKLEQAKGYYTCGFLGCNFSCTSEANFKVHLNEEHLGTSFPCVFCCHSLTSASSLIQHMKSHQSGAKNFMLYCCSMDCNFCTNQAGQFTLHLDMCHSTKEDFPCSFCNEKFNAASLINHLRHSLVKLVNCPYCFVRSVCKREVLNHLRRVHPYLPNRIVVTSRMSCQEDKNIRSISPPKPVEESEKMLDCRACGFQTSDVDSLKQHIQKCEKAKNFHRLMADKNNKKTETLETTQVSREEDKVVKNVPISKQVVEESDSHSEERHRCPECKKGFSSSKHLSLHVKCYHKGEILLKSEECNYCSEKSHNYNWMVKHSKEAHPSLPVKYNITENDITCDNISCEKCTFIYKRNSFSSYVSHCVEMHYSDKEFLENVKKNHPLLQLKASPSNMQTADQIIDKSNEHDSGDIGTSQSGNNVNLLSCSSCDANFLCLDKFKRHVAMHFSGKKEFKLFKCQSCDFIGTNKIFIRDHLRDKHPLKSPHMDIHNICIIGTGRNVENESCDQADSSEEDRSDSIECFYCDETFKNNFYFHKHIYSKHRQDELQKMKNQIIQCIYCSFKTQFEYKIRYHIRTEHKKEKYGVIRKVLDVSHTEKLASKMKPREFARDHDDSSSTDDTKTELSAHEYTKLGPRKFKCNKCSFTQRSLSALKKHVIRAHHNSHQYQCKYCDFTALDRSKVTKHGQNVHNKVCIQICTTVKSNAASFLNAIGSGMRKRSLSQDNDDFVPSKKAKTSNRKSSDSAKTSDEDYGTVENVVKKQAYFKCANCEYTHIDDNVVRKHIAKRHSRCDPNSSEALTKVQRSKSLKRYHCNFCNYYSDYSMRDLMRHCQCRHDMDPEPLMQNKSNTYSCKYCSFKAEKQDIVEAHQNEQHAPKNGNVNKSNNIASDNEKIWKKEKVTPQKLKTIKLESGGYKCHDCTFKEEKDYVKRHYAVVHLKLPWIYGCGHCSYVTTSMAHAKSHGSSMHQLEESYIVKRIDASSIVDCLVSRNTNASKDTENGNSSKQTSSNEEETTSSLCKSNVPTGDTYISRPRRIEYVPGPLLPPYPDGNKFRCPYCFFHTYSLENAEIHLQHHGPYQYKCTYCSWRGFCSSSAKRHCRMKHKGTKAVCMHIKPKKNDALKPEKIPEKIASPKPKEKKTFECFYCDFQGNKLLEVKDHQNIKHSKKNLKMRVHGRDLLEKNSLEIRLFKVRCDGDGFCRCKYCPFKTKMLIGMKKHLGNHFHLVNCKYCDYSAPFRFNLNCHISKKHPSHPLLPHIDGIRLNTYCCNWCPVVVRSEMDFITHLAEHSNIFSSTRTDSLVYVNIQPTLQLNKLHLQKPLQYVQHDPELSFVNDEK
ncbi:uncharacterized protein LOC141900068 [Tubulanus polymorphus]|uniref:uncharacterized protein LOC141900068 n=1 Tax=Tubulanus polymorphus TaxID=672921 RepID=UPI003DA571AF